MRKICAIQHDKMTPLKQRLVLFTPLSSVEENKSYFRLSDANKKITVS